VRQGATRSIVVYAAGPEARIEENPEFPGGFFDPRRGGKARHTLENDR